MMVFDFRNDEPHGLVVLGKGEPVADARVEVVDVAAPLPVRLDRRSPRTPLLVDRTTTDSKGRWSTVGDPDGLYVAYVYADGYEPARVRLVSGSDKHVELVARDRMVRFRGARTGDLLCVRLARRESVVAQVRAIDDAPILVELAPGTYDATVEDARGEIVTGTTITVSDASPVVDLVQDRRPQVVLYLREMRNSRGLFVGGTRRALPHQDYGVAGFLRSWRDLVDSQPPATVEWVDDATRVLRFPGSGRWQVHVGSSRADRSLFTEVNLAPGEIRELHLPPLDASLEGTMTYEPDPDDRVIAYHWVDGPRMMLIATGDSGTRWNAMSYLPRPRPGGREPHTFAMRALPAGEYHLFHHLADVEGWGGREVTLVAGATTRVEGLGTDRPARLVVEVQDAEGQPVRDRILRIRDRMYKPWRPPGRITITGGSGPRVPVPPAVHLNGEPVTFDSIRPGWLELVVDDPAGDARHYLRKVEPGKTLRLVVGS